MMRSVFCCLAFILSLSVRAQRLVQVKIVDSLHHVPVPSASIALGGKVIAVSDTLGLARLSLNAGEQLLTVSALGYSARSFLVGEGRSPLIEIYLPPAEHQLEDVTIVASTRSNQRIENSPLKVEVLGGEEMEEENAIKPGNIASILGDISGVQIQQSSAVSGNANVRIQGLEGRYTQILRDGMPLYEGFSGGFGILSIPPLDLKQIELIKGSASTLYGGGAIGGLVNIISKKPAAQQEAVFTLNHSTLKESNINTYLARRYKKAGYTFFGGFTNQQAVDVNKDGFSDLPKTNALVLHPRLFFYPDEKTWLSIGYTATMESRKGGDMFVLKNDTDALHQYFEKNNLQRHTGELMFEKKGDNRIWNFKASVSAFRRSIGTERHFFRARQLNYFSELTLLLPGSGGNFVAGLNFLGDAFHLLPSDPVRISNASSHTLGAFAQYSYTLQEKTIIEAGIRNDYHNHYKNFLLPRLAVFHRINEAWGLRAGAGAGYKIPDPLTPQVIDYPIESILPIPPSVKAERSAGYNLEVNYKKRWGVANRIFVNHAFFLTRIGRPLVATELPGGDLAYSNAVRPVITKGFDTYIQTRLSGWELYAGYTYTIAERTYLAQNQFIPLTPRTRMAFTMVREWTRFRVGLEGSYNGFQRRLDYSKTPSYFFIAAMIEKKFGEGVTVVLNGENLLDFRQSKKEPLFTGSVTHPQFQPLWAPIDGRVINLSVKFELESD